MRDRRSRAMSCATFIHTARQPYSCLQVEHVLFVSLLVGRRVALEFVHLVFERLPPLLRLLRREVQLLERQLLLGAPHRRSGDLWTREDQTRKQGTSTGVSDAEGIRAAGRSARARDAKTTNLLTQCLELLVELRILTERRERKRKVQEGDQKVRTARRLARAPSGGGPCGSPLTAGIDPFRCIRYGAYPKRSIRQEIDTSGHERV